LFDARLAGLGHDNPSLRLRQLRERGVILLDDAPADEVRAIEQDVVLVLSSSSSGSSTSFREIHT